MVKLYVKALELRVMAEKRNSMFLVEKLEVFMNEIDRPMAGGLSFLARPKHHKTVSKNAWLTYVLTPQ